MNPQPTTGEILEVLLDFRDAVSNRFDFVDRTLAEHSRVLEQHSQTLNRHDRKLQSIDFRLEGVDERLDTMDERFDGVDRRLDKMDERFDGVDRRLDKMDERFDGVDRRFDKDGRAFRRSRSAVRQDGRAFRRNGSAARGNGAIQTIAVLMQDDRYCQQNCRGVFDDRCRNRMNRRDEPLAHSKSDIRSRGRSGDTENGTQTRDVAGRSREHCPAESAAEDPDEGRGERRSRGHVGQRVNDVLAYGTGRQR